MRNGQEIKMKFAVEFFGLVLFVYLIFIVLAQKTKLRIVNGNKSVSGSTSGLTQISFAGIFDGGEGGEFLDDAFVPIPLGGSGMVFNFFGTNYSTSISWNTNNALVFGTSFATSIVSVSGVTGKAILLGNYDRICKSLHYSNTIKSAYSFTTILVTFSDYFTDNTSTYKYQIRLIKEKVGSLRQFVEVCIVTSPPSPGYSSNASVSYPSGTQEYPASSGLFVAQDSAGFRIDTTKQSPYNITNGSSFLNTCGSTFATSSPPAGSSFVLSSDSTGSTWTFTNNCYVNVV
jgi:hypothetical protein